MLNGASVDVPRSSRMGSPIQADAALPKEAGAYLKAANLHESDDCRFKASKLRSVTTIQTSDLLAQADSAMPNSQGNTLLCLAAQTGNLAWGQQLILRGADVHHLNLDGDNALTLAATGGHLTFIKWLDGHCPQPVNHENYYADTALTLAARHGHQPLVQWLISRDASVTHLNDQLKDALAEAVANGHLALAEWLSSQDTDLRRVYPDGNNLFLHAVCAGHQSVAQWLEDSGIDSQQINESGDSAITLAARHGHQQLLAWLLGKHAAGIHQISDNGDSPLLMAARQGHCQTVKLLVQNGADTGLVNYAGNSVLTLAAASSEPLALWLCSIGTNIHHIELSGNNAFTLAAQSGFFQLMQTLVQLGINIHQVNENNDNAFTLVARQGSLSWCQWLAGQGINIHQVNCMQHNAFTLAALAGSLPLLQWLWAEDVDSQQIPKTSMYNSINPNIPWLSYGFNAAILAASAGHFSEAQWLMEQGLSIHQRDYYSRNAVIQAVGLGQLDAVKWFSAQGIMPDGFPDGVPDRLKDNKYTAMSLAAHLGHLHILKWLHQNGGSLGVQDDGKIPLMLAASRGDLPMTEWLCQQGADLGRLDGSSNSALGMAVGCGHLRLSQWLVGQGAEDIPNFSGNTALMLAAIKGRSPIFRWLSRSKYLNDRQANDLLLHALRSGHRSLAVWLCLNVCNSFGGADNQNHNALMLAAENGFLWLTRWLSKQPLDVNQTNLEGYTALMLAADNGHLPVVQWLYTEKNANLYRQTYDGSDALHLAVIRGQTETANWLISQGMALAPDYFKEHSMRWISNRNNLIPLQFLLRRQLIPSKFLVDTMLNAARRGDVPVLACCLSEDINKPLANAACVSCFTEASSSGSLVTLEFLCQYSEGNRGVDKARRLSLLTAARYGNLHIIQWFWRRSGLSKHENDACLLAASGYDQFHVVKWLFRLGANIESRAGCAYRALSNTICCGNTLGVEWFCQQGVDPHQVEEDGDGALSLAIACSRPQVARWLFHHGFRLTKRDVKFASRWCEKQVLGMIFKMTSRIRRALLFHSCSLDQKLRLLDLLRADSDNEILSEEEADASFARFNQYSDKTLEHKCLVALTNLIGQQSGTLEAGFKVVNNLPISAESKFNLRELVSIHLEQ